MSKRKVSRRDRGWIKLNRREYTKHTGRRWYASGEDHVASPWLDPVTGRVHWLANRDIKKGEKFAPYVGCTLPKGKKEVDCAWLHKGDDMMVSAAYMGSFSSDSNEGIPNFWASQKESAAKDDIAKNSEIFNYYEPVYSDIRLEVLAWDVPSMSLSDSHSLGSELAQALIYVLPNICQKLFNSQGERGRKILIELAADSLPLVRRIKQVVEVNKDKLGGNYNAAMRYLSAQESLYKFIEVYSDDGSAIDRFVGLMKACMLGHQSYSPIKLSLVTFHWLSLSGSPDPLNQLGRHAQIVAKSLCETMLGGVQPEITREQPYELQATLLMQRIHKLQRCIKLADHYGVELQFEPQKQLIVLFWSLYNVHITNRRVKDDLPELVWIHKQVHGIWDDPALQAHYAQLRQTSAASC